MEDAIARLEHFRAPGPPPGAFTVRERFEPGGGGVQLCAERDTRKLLTLVYFGLRDGEIRCLADKAG